MKLKGIISTLTVILLIFSSCADKKMSMHNIPRVSQVITLNSDNDAEITNENNDNYIDNMRANLIPKIGTVTDMPETSLKKYTYNLLSDKEKEIYKKIYIASANYMPYVDFGEEIPFSVIQNVYALLYLQEYHLFWLSGKYEIFDGKRSQIPLEYICSKEEAELSSEEINNKTAEIILQVKNRNRLDIDNAVILHDYITENVEYVKTGGSGMQSIYGGLKENQAQSQGYSKTFGFLCNILGIENILIKGLTENGTAHSWNMIKIDGDWINVDVTFDDNGENAGHNYFNVSDSDILNKTHFQDLTYFKPPECNSDKYNYYKYYGIYAGGYNEAYKLFKKRLVDNSVYLDPDISIRLSSKEEYLKAKQHLKDENGFFDIIEEANKSAVNKISNNEVYIDFNDNMYIINFTVSYL